MKVLTVRSFVAKNSLKDSKSSIDQKFAKFMIAEIEIRRKKLDSGKFKRAPKTEKA